jgi:hypothetical protein
VNDPSRDDRDHPPDEPAGGRRSACSRRAAIAVLVAFGAFVLFNAVTVLVLLLSAASRGTGGPFGN